MISVIIADDQELMRESLNILIGLNENFKIAGLAKDGIETLRIAKRENPDVVLLDIRMPELNGIECTKLLKEYNQKIKILILTTFNDDEYVYNALKNGADGFILKGVSTDDLINSIINVYNGGSVLDPLTAKKVFSIFGKMANSYAMNLEMQNERNENLLSEIEIKIIQLIGKGCSNKEIMTECYLSEGTIRNYISAILKKLDLKNRTQIAIFAIQSGMMVKKLENEFKNQS